MNRVTFSKVLSKIKNDWFHFTIVLIVLSFTIERISFSFKHANTQTAGQFVDLLFYMLISFGVVLLFVGFIYVLPLVFIFEVHSKLIMLNSYINIELRIKEERVQKRVDNFYVFKNNKLCLRI